MQASLPPRMACSRSSPDTRHSRCPACACYGHRVRRHGSNCGGWAAVGCCRDWSCCGAAARLPCLAIRPPPDMPPAARRARPLRPSWRRRQTPVRAGGWCRSRRNRVEMSKMRVGASTSSFIRSYSVVLPATRFRGRRKVGANRRTPSLRAPSGTRRRWQQSGRAREKENGSPAPACDPPPHDQTVIARPVPRLPCQGPALAATAAPC